MKVEQIFDEVAQRMRSDLKRTRLALKHPGLKGSAFEDIFRGFLREYLPQALDISTGVLFDSQGLSSRQVDVVISDALKTPLFYRTGEVRAMPIECAYSVIEVKAKLTQDELLKACNNMRSVKELEKRAFLTGTR